MHVRATLILIWLVLCGCTPTARTPVRAHRAPIAYDWPATCPEGHTELRQVPVVYGLLTPEIVRRELAMEFFPGGCRYLRGISPEALLVCGRCRNLYHPTTASWWGKSKGNPSAAEHDTAHAIQ